MLMDCHRITSNSRQIPIIMLQKSTLMTCRIVVTLRNFNEYAIELLRIYMRPLKECKVQG